MWHRFAVFATSLDPSTLAALGLVIAQV